MHTHTPLRAVLFHEDGKSSAKTIPSTLFDPFPISWKVPSVKYSHLFGPHKMQLIFLRDNTEKEASENILVKCPRLISSQGAEKEEEKEAN